MTAAPATVQTIAIIAANGFDENHMTEIQRALTKAKFTYKIVAPEQGLVNGWQDGGWGHYFTVDAPIGTALGSDYDALILVGGERATAKLKTNPHTRRIINHFVEAQKPLAAIGSGVSLLALSPQSKGKTVSAPAESHAELSAAGLLPVEDKQNMDGDILTASGEDSAAWAEATLALFSMAEELVEAA